MGAVGLKGLRIMGLFSIIFLSACFQPGVLAARNIELVNVDYIPPETHVPAPDGAPNADLVNVDYVPPEIHVPAPDEAPDSRRTWVETSNRATASGIHFFEKPRDTAVPPSGVAAPGIHHVQTAQTSQVAPGTFIIGHSLTVV